MLSSILQSILFKLLTNKDYYKLLTVCQGNDLHFLKKPLDIQFLKLLLSLWIMKDYWDDRFFCLALRSSFRGRKQLLPELVLGVWLPALESSFPCTWVYMLRPVASDLPRHTSLLWPWAGSLEGAGSLAIRRVVYLSGALALHLFPETSYVCP